MKEQVLQILNHPDLSIFGKPDAMCDQILAFLAEWKKWSCKIDLTSEDDEPSVLRKHVFDSLQYARALRRDGRTLDIGSGAGFPGIPLKIACPEMHMVLVESRRKRASFLKSVVRTLKLTHIEVVNCRIEDLMQREEYVARFDQVVFKAVAPLSQCLEWGFPFLRENGLIVIKKEPGDPADGGPSLRLREKIPVRSLSGVVSDLLIFEKCST